MPRWNRNGRELLYVAADRQLMTVPVRTSPSLVLGTPQRLFDVQGGTEWSDPRATSAWADMDLSADGTRILAAIPRPANGEPLTAIVNWPQAIARP